jgi:hypothetical protein
MKRGMRLYLLALLFVPAACDVIAPESDADRPETSREFPRAQRAVSKLGSNQFSTEIQRDSVGEAQREIELAAELPGITEPDNRAGESY